LNGWKTSVYEILSFYELKNFHFLQKQLEKYLHNSNKMITFVPEIIKTTFTN